MRANPIQRHLTFLGLCAKYSWARKPLPRKSFVGGFFASGLNFAEADPPPARPPGEPFQTHSLLLAAVFLTSSPRTKNNPFSADCNTARVMMYGLVWMPLCMPLSPNVYRALCLMLAATTKKTPRLRPSRQLLCCAFARRCVAHRSFLSISPAIYRALKFPHQHNIMACTQWDVEIWESLFHSRAPACQFAPPLEYFYDSNLSDLCWCSPERTLCRTPLQNFTRELPLLIFMARSQRRWKMHKYRTGLVKYSRIKSNGAKQLLKVQKRHIHFPLYIFITQMSIIKWI